MYCGTTSPSKSARTCHCHLCSTSESSQVDGPMSRPYFSTGTGHWGASIYLMCCSLLTLRRTRLNESPGPATIQSGTAIPTSLPTITTPGATTVCGSNPRRPSPPATNQAGTACQARQGLLWASAWLPRSVCLLGSTRAGPGTCTRTRPTGHLAEVKNGDCMRSQGGIQYENTTGTVSWITLLKGKPLSPYFAQINAKEPIRHAWNTGSCWEEEVWDNQGAHRVSLFLRGIDCQERMPHETGGEWRQSHPLHDRAQCFTCMPQSPALCTGLARPPTEPPAAHHQCPTSCFQRRRWYRALTVHWSLMSCQHSQLRSQRLSGN